ncbi:MAG: heavy metal translocating P-type ATPase [Kordiimonas sp.]|nr:heavy metal translocating P-type ATPase [Kordiimonas sp.]
MPAPSPHDTQHIEHFVVDNLHCPSCIREIESTLYKIPDIEKARVNLSTHRLTVEWKPDNLAAADNDLIIQNLDSLGFKASLFRPDELLREQDKESRKLLKAMAVAGFATANIMLLSVSVWAGNASDMGQATRDLMHWVSALIALPVVTYSGMPFFRSAIGSIKARKLNMDVPISLAVILACIMSLIETINGSEYAYFDAAVMLLFFLLIGRYLDRIMRNKARSVAQNLMALRAPTAQIIDDDGQTRTMAVENITPGMVIHIRPGDRIPVDGHIINGQSDIDTSLITGESLPRTAGPDDDVFAGTVNLTGRLTVRARVADGHSLLDEIVNLMEIAEQGRSRYVRLADKAAEIYVPAVHSIAAATFIGWWIFGGGGWQLALMNAIAVLIITCPCALGLAVPAVQVVASSRLFKAGILVKAADGLERFAEIDTVIFDKTGTLTLGQPELANTADIDDDSLQLAAQLARGSTHPLCRALIVALHSRGKTVPPADEEIHENAGMGIEANMGGRLIRLGNRQWCDIPNDAGIDPSGSEIWLVCSGKPPVQFLFRDSLRADARDVVHWLQQKGMHVELLSGDRSTVVADTARELGLTHATGELKPQDKIQRLEELKSQGRKILMVGDGLNDAPALAAAHVSMSPSSAADISQTAADFVFQTQYLSAVIKAYQVSHSSRRLVLQNFSLAAAYNVIAIPVAAIGLLTPLIAAIAMSGSSLVVTGNALRLNLMRLFSSTAEQEIAQPPTAVAPSKAPLP